MKVLVINLNTHEDACISALTRDSRTEFVKLAYPNAAGNVILPASTPYGKVEIDRVNATDPEAIAKAASGMDFVVDMTEAWMSPYVKKGAIQAGVSYIDPKADSVFWQQFIRGNRSLQSAPSIIWPERKSFRHRKHL